MGDVRQAAFELADAAATFGAAALKLAALDIRCDTTLPNEVETEQASATVAGQLCAEDADHNASAAACFRELDI
ncbi:TPA: hypothetical protein ACH3X1_015301 [Trebouxia sp. C0004]